MAHYLVQASYTNEGWSVQTRNPQNITDRISPMVQGLGGSIESVFYSFGEYDVVAIVQFPDNVSVANAKRPGPGCHSSNVDASADVPTAMSELPRVAERSSGIAVPPS